MNEVPEANVWVGLDLGGTKMLAVVFDEKFQPLGRKRKRTKGHEGQEAGVERMADTVRNAIDDAGLSVAQIAGIGVGCPGPVDAAQGVLLEAVNLGWQDVPLAKLLSDKLGCPVEVLNDVDAGVYGENRFGAAQGARTAVGIFPGTGIGGGCVYEGQVVRGRGISCMEIGHIQVREGGNLCGCGHRGCLETEASRLAISAEVAKAAYRGQAPYIMQHAETTLGEIRSGVLASAIKAGDDAVEQIMRRASEHLGVAVANIVHLIAPDAVVLGGGLVEAMPDLIVKTVARTANERVMKPFRESFVVVAAALGDDSSVMGAAAWAQHVNGSR